MTNAPRAIAEQKQYHAVTSEAKSDACEVPILLSRFLSYHRWLKLMAGKARLCGQDREDDNDAWGRLLTGGEWDRVMTRDKPSAALPRAEPIFQAT